MHQEYIYNISKGKRRGKNMFSHSREPRFNDTQTIALINQGIS